jgi:hypothetical protein
VESPTIPKIDLPLLRAHDPHDMPVEMVANTLLEKFPQGAEWKVLLPVIKFMGYHTQCTNKRIWLGLVAQFEHVLTEEIRLDEPPGPTDEMSDKEFREHMRLLEEFSFCVECFVKKRCPVTLWDRIETIIRAQLAVLPPVVASRLFATAALMRKPSTDIIDGLAIKLTEVAPLLPVYYATLALRTIETQEHIPHFKMTEALSKAKAELLHRHNRKVRKNPKGHSMAKHKIILDIKELQAGNITSAMKKRVKPEVLQQLQEAKAQGVKDLAPIIYKYPLNAYTFKRIGLNGLKRKNRIRDRDRPKIPQPAALPERLYIG